MIKYNPLCITSISVATSRALCGHEKKLRLFGAKQQKTFCAFSVIAIGYIVCAALTLYVPYTSCISVIYPHVAMLWLQYRRCGTNKIQHHQIRHAKPTIKSFYNRQAQVVESAKRDRADLAVA